MSMHSSLKTSGKMGGTRSVWTRMERLTALKKAGRWQDGDSVVGLPKVRTQFKSKSKKQLKAEAAAEKTGETEAAEGEAAAPKKE